MDLQLFANNGDDDLKDDDLDDDKKDDDLKDDKKDDDTKEKDTFTKEEYESKLQSETDKRVTQALKKQERKLDDEIREADKLKSMSDEQKERYKFEQREKDLIKKEKEYALMENKVECSNILSERGLPKEFLNYVVAEDAEQMMGNIDTMDRVFKSAVADAVGSKIDKKVPRHSSEKQASMTKEKFGKLSLAQQSDIYKTNPTLWKQMNS